MLMVELGEVITFESAGKRPIHDLSRFGDDGIQVMRILETLGVDLVEVLSARGSRRKPAARGNNL